MGSALDQAVIDGLLAIPGALNEIAQNLDNARSFDPTVGAGPGPRVIVPGPVLTDSQQITLGARDTVRTARGTTLYYQNDTTTTSYLYVAFAERASRIVYSFRMLANSLYETQVMGANGAYDGPIAVLFDDANGRLLVTDFS